MNKPKAGQVEQRNYATELRTLKDMEVSGYAAQFGTYSRDLGGFREVIARGAFSRSLRSADSDVKALFNHDPSQILGRQQNGTLEVSEDERGLKWRCTLNKESQAHRDLYAAIKRGDISECSFAFTVEPDGDAWDNAEEDGVRFTRRTLKNVKLLDVSAVTYPAYGQGTSIAARKFDYLPARRLSARFWQVRKELCRISEATGLSFEAVVEAMRCKTYQSGAMTDAERDALNKLTADLIGTQIQRDRRAYNEELAERRRIAGICGRTGDPSFTEKEL